tara:strand:+ start:4610 stop:5449 length:840 start_codon:yes stop_codon:yes gene_type:complete
MKYLILFLLTPVIIFSQNNDFVIGINGGVYFANRNTSIQYNGFYNNYGINSILNQSNNKPYIDQYFQNTFNSQIYSISDGEIERLENNIKYNASPEIGFHLGLVNKNSKLFVDINFSNIRVQDFIAFEVQNQNFTMSTEPQYVPISITGKEKRNIINLGYQKKIYEESKITILYPIFIQFLKVEIDDNFVTINNQPYPIIHNFQTSNNPIQNQGRIGLGLGSGIIVNYFINKDACFDFGYHIQYSKTNFSENLNPWGIQHSLFARIIVNGSKYLSNLNN